MAHVRIFLKDMAHLLGLVAPEGQSRRTPDRA
jgi:hypothetical protein